MTITLLEKALIFGCEGESLVGILHAPQASHAPADTAVVIIVGGPQYRVGSHRQFVHLARTLAAAGYPVLRFDYRGMGDSSGKATDFENVSADIAAAIEVLQQHMPSVRRVVLWGLCDGASAALLYLHQTLNSTVQGLCLVNPWVRSGASQARTHVKHYYMQRLMQREFWLKLVKGNLARNAFGELARSLRTAAVASTRPPGAALEPLYTQRMAEACRRFGGPILLVLSSEDYTAKEFIEHAKASDTWTTNLRSSRLTRHDCARADHTFSSAALRRQLADLTLHWLGSFAKRDHRLG